MEKKLEVLYQGTVHKQSALFYAHFLKCIPINLQLDKVAAGLEKQQEIFCTV